MWTMETHGGDSGRLTGGDSSSGSELIVERDPEESKRGVEPLEEPHVPDTK